jgi:hypothetical protein
MLDRLTEITQLGNYKEPYILEKIYSSFLTDTYPIVSTKIFEVIGNCGWQIHIDATCALLNVILYQKYGINLDYLLDSKYLSRMDSVRADKLNPPQNPFNTSIPSYYYTLIEQQAKNIYLNMKEDGVLKDYIINQEIFNGTQCNNT